jgi:hypothetical protein
MRAEPLPKAPTCVDREIIDFIFSLDQLYDNGRVGCARRCSPPFQFCAFDGVEGSTATFTWRNVVPSTLTSPGTGT